MNGFPLDVECVNVLTLKRMTDLLAESIRKSAKRGHCTRAEQECCIMHTGNNRQLPKHKLSQNAKNLQCLHKFGLIEGNVTVFNDHEIQSPGS